MIDELQRLLPWLSELPTMGKAVALGGAVTVTLVAALLVSLPRVEQPSEKPQRQASDATEAPQQSGSRRRDG